jgi:hypothetical protein
MVLQMSVPTVREAKNRLKQRGLINFKSPEKASKGFEGQTKYWLSTVQKNYTVPLTDGYTVPLTNNKLNQTKLNIEKKLSKKEFKVLFDEFRKMYPGSKRGLDTEFENFHKKNPDYGEIIPLLIPSLEKLISWREKKRNAGQFVPEWANLQTWINQRRWEVELEQVDTSPTDEVKSRQIRNYDEQF